MLNLTSVADGPQLSDKRVNGVLAYALTVSTIFLEIKDGTIAKGREPSIDKKAASSIWSKHVTEILGGIEFYPHRLRYMSSSLKICANHFSKQR